MEGAHGKTGQTGQFCRETAVHRSSSSAKPIRAEDNDCRHRGVRRERLKAVSCWKMQRPHLRRNLHCPSHSKSDWNAQEYPAQDSKTLPIPWLEWRRKRCSKAGLPCCTIRGTGHEAACSQGWLQGCEGGCAARGAQGCPSEQGPCALSVCQGWTLLPARVSTQPAWDHLMVLGGETVGENETLARARSFCC